MSFCFISVNPSNLRKSALNCFFGERSFFALIIIYGRIVQKSAGKGRQTPLMLIISAYLLYLRFLMP